MEAEDQSRPLCLACENIIAWTKSSDRQEQEEVFLPFQPSFEALQASALSCRFCEYVLKGVLGGRPLHSGYTGPEEGNPLSYKARVTAERDLRRGVFSIQWAEEPLYPSPHLGNTDCYYISYPENASKKPAWQQRGLDIDSRLQTVSEWISDCLQHHPQCVSTASTLPKRLVDLRNVKNLHEVKLVESEALHGQPIQYATLSHCWGPPSEPPLKTNSSNMLNHFQGIPLGTLTLNFRDAVSICSKLGLDYIWIDSLCIIQDDQADWECEAFKMADIYRGSYLNIGAAAAPDAHSGMLGQSSLRDPGVRLKRIDYLDSNAGPHPKSAPESFLIQRDFGLDDYSELQDSVYPYFGRGWILQEQVLPPRTVLFPKGQMFWQCYERFGSEDDTMWRNDFWSIGNSRMGQQVFDLGSSEAALSTWRMWVQSYARRNFTFITDVAPAISGPLRFFVEKTGFTPMLGLWKESLGFDLCWEVVYSPGNDQAPEPFRAGNFPSWSWLSVLERDYGIYSLNLVLPTSFETSSVRIECWEEEWEGLAYTSKLTRSKLVISAITQEATLSSGTADGRRYALKTPGWSSYECTVNDPLPVHATINVKLVHMFQSSVHADDSVLLGDRFLIVKRKHVNSGPFYRIGTGRMRKLLKEGFTRGEHCPLWFDQRQRESIELI